MKILFCHTNYPSQFRRLAPALAERGHEIVFLHKSREWHAHSHDLVRTLEYIPSRLSASKQGLLHPYLGRFEDAVLEGQAAARAAISLKERGFIPDVIISHAGFGNGLYLKDVFPNTPRIGFFEWYYTSEVGGDVYFLYQLSGSEVPLDRAMRLRTWNAVTLLELAQSDAFVVPTSFQREQFPSVYRNQFTQIHEGVDVKSLSDLRTGLLPRPDFFPNNLNTKVVTYLARGFEVYRGFPQAIQALALLQQRMPDVHVVIAGADQICYGGPSQAPDGRTWGSWAKESAGLVSERTSWTGILQTNDYHRLLAHSDAHLYLTIPFVLSWSLIEAMSAGVPLVCSDTGPVQEVLEHGRDALLIPFDDHNSIANALQDCIVNPNSAMTRARNAQHRASAYDSSIALDSWDALLEEVMRVGTVRKA